MSMRNWIFKRRESLLDATYCSARISPDLTDVERNLYRCTSKFKSLWNFSPKSKWHEWLCDRFVPRDPYLIFVLLFRLLKTACYLELFFLFMSMMCYVDHHNFNNSSLMVKYVFSHTLCVQALSKYLSIRWKYIWAVAGSNLYIQELFRQCT